MNLLREAIDVEAGLHSADDVRRLLAAGGEKGCVRLLIEPTERTSEDALTTADAIIHLLDKAGLESSRLLHGYAETTWRLLDYALDLGYETRIGFQDTGELPDGEFAVSNAELIQAAHARAPSRRIKHG